MADAPGVGSYRIFQLLARNAAVVAHMVNNISDAKHVANVGCVIYSAIAAVQALANYDKICVINAVNRV